MKTTLLSIGLGVTLLSASAFADEGFAHGRGHNPRQQHQQHGWHQGHTGANCDYHRASAPGGEYSNGSYELRSVQKWVPGSYVQVWVAQQCSHYQHGRRGHRCNNGGYYTQQWQAGRYETVQEWVFVPRGRYPRYGAATVTETPVAVGVSFSNQGGSAYVNAQTGGFGLSFSAMF